MKLSLRFSTFIFFTALLSGCNFAESPTKHPFNPTSQPVILPTFSPVPTEVLFPEPTASQNALVLELGDQKIALEFFQNDISVPSIKNNDFWTVSLKPEPFILRVFGDKNIVSVMALKSTDMTLPLQNASGPLVSISMMGNGFWEHNLYLFDEPKEIELYDFKTFADQGGLKPDEASAVSDYLKNKFNAEPIMLNAVFTNLGGEPNYSINKISNKTMDNYIQSGNSMALVVFIEKDLGENPLSPIAFFQVNWVIFDIKFQ